MLRLAIALFVVLFFWVVVPFAQDQPGINYATIEQCRVLVMVLRGQLVSAQDSWAFWAQHADTLQKQVKKLQKDVSKKEEEKKVNE